MLPLTHIRGRSLHDAFVIVDEAQSLERNVLLTVLSRIGKDSRVVLTHDIAQRDNLRVGRYDGVVAVVEKLKGHPLFAHVTLTRAERSPIAALVTEMLEDLGAGLSGAGRRHGSAAGCPMSSDPAASGWSTHSLASRFEESLPGVVALMRAYETAALGRTDTTAAEAEAELRAPRWTGTTARSSCGATGDRPAARVRRSGGT